jgi:hypothetical protein
VILYFDSYITDIPLNGKTQLNNDRVRESCKNYEMPSKIDIAKYTLASYAQYNWEYVLIKYEVDDQKDYKILDKFILKLFPTASIFHKRSDSFSSFQESLKIINTCKSNWIFYTGNNDQPWIGKGSSYINELIDFASKYEKDYKYISIKTTHFSENLFNNNSPQKLRFGRDAVNLEENSKASIFLTKQGDNTSHQIVNKNLLNYWFSSKLFADKRIIRSEDIRYLYLTSNQIVVYPMEEICAHFDAYPHTLGTNIEISDYQAPPLIIPPGFFTKTIKIRYGYSDYIEGWLNVNPINSNYIFEDREGVDLKTDLGKLPSFWSDRIINLDINKNINQLELDQALKKNKEIFQDPWKFKNKKFNINSIKYFLRYLILFIWVRSGLVIVTHDLNERRVGLKKILSYLKPIKKFFSYYRESL